MIRAKTASASARGRASRRKEREGLFMTCLSEAMVIFNPFTTSGDDLCEIALAMAKTEWKNEQKARVPARKPGEIEPALEEKP